MATLEENADAGDGNQSWQEAEVTFLAEQNKDENPCRSLMIPVRLHTTHRLRKVNFHRGESRRVRPGDGL